MGSPKHVVFYDDFVVNPASFADYLCNQEKPKGLEQVTVVWYATPTAKKRDVDLRIKMRKGADTGVFGHSKGSYFNPDPEEDARLAGYRSLFKWDDNVRARVPAR